MTAASGLAFSAANVLDNVGEYEGALSLTGLSQRLNARCTESWSLLLYCIDLRGKLPRVFQRLALSLRRAIPTTLEDAKKAALSQLASFIEQPSSVDLATVASAIDIAVLQGDIAKRMHALLESYAAGHVEDSDTIPDIKTVKNL